MTIEPDVCFYLAHVLIPTDRHEDMLKLIKDAITVNPVLDSEQRDLLSVSYKSLISTRRTGLRYLASLVDRDEAKISTFRIAQVVEFQKTLVRELDEYCHDLIDLVDSTLLPAAQGSSDARVYYEKLKGDYWRYISENKTGEEKESAANSARDAYDRALEIARDAIPLYGPAYLGLVLNYTVCLYEILGKKEEAIALSDSTCASASCTLDSNADEAQRAEAEKIIGLLRDNVNLWRQTKTE
jgi:14-3-3 protein epsilon